MKTGRMAGTNVKSANSHGTVFSGALGDLDFLATAACVIFAVGWAMFSWVHPTRTMGIGPASIAAATGAWLLVRIGPRILALSHRATREEASLTFFEEREYLDRRLHGPLWKACCPALFGIPTMILGVCLAATQDGIAATTMGMESDATTVALALFFYIIVALVLSIVIVAGSVAALWSLLYRLCRGGDYFHESLRAWSQWIVIGVSPPVLFASLFPIVNSPGSGKDLTGLLLLVWVSVIPMAIVRYRKKALNGYFKFE